MGQSKPRISPIYWSRQDTDCTQVFSNCSLQKFSNVEGQSGHMQIILPSALKTKVCNRSQWQLLNTTLI